MRTRARREAQFNKTTRYFTGIPCRYGHIAERLTSTGQCLICAKRYVNTWRRKYPEKVRKQGRGWVAKNKAIKQESDCLYYKNHREKIIENVKRWTQTNPEANRAIKQNYRSRRNTADGRFSKEDIQRIRKQQRGRCAEPSCRKKLTLSNEQVDHIMPLAKCGTNWPRNLQLLCRNCNASKQDTDPLIYAKRHGRII